MEARRLREAEDAAIRASLVEASTALSRKSQEANVGSFPSR